MTVEDVADMSHRFSQTRLVLDIFLRPLHVLRHANSHYP